MCRSLSQTKTFHSSLKLSKAYVLLSKFYWQIIPQPWSGYCAYQAVDDDVCFKTIAGQMWCTVSVDFHRSHVMFSFCVFIVISIRLKRQIVTNTS